jgi:hypothetical protein
MQRLKVFALALSLATLASTALGQSGNQATPGTLNYIEGPSSIEGRQLYPTSVGNTTLRAGETLATANGKAEILLTPGIFLRLGDESMVQMISPDLTHTEIRLDRGQANIEVDQIYAQNRILIDLKDGQTQILKNGLYTFDADHSTVRVFDGKAAVYPGTNLQTNVKPIELKGGHQLVLNGEPLKPQHFNKDQASADQLYRWSSLRSQYLGDANLGLAEAYSGYSGFNPGWYWAGGPFGYTWLPGDGFLWSPFGYGFYSPFYIRGGGFIYGRGFYGGGFRGGAYRGGGVRGAGVGGGGGFHGGGGDGFHGGGGGGHR